MTASEFAFLALGLILGVASGAALIEVLRSRPPAPREVRLTVTPDSVPRRGSTLSSAASPAASGPARGGPADRRNADRPDEPEADQAAASVSPAVDPTAPEPPARAVPSRTDVRAVPVGPGVPADGSASRAGGRREPEKGGRPAAPAIPEARPLVGIAIEPDRERVASRARASLLAATRVAEGPIAARIREQQATAAAVLPDWARPMGAAERTAGRPRATSGAADPAPSARKDDDPVGAGTSASGLTGNHAADPCSDARRLADERCAVADRLTEQAEAVARALRDAQRDYDEHRARAADATARSDPRALRAAKEAAQQQFRTANARAGSRDDVETAARTWLQEINRINTEAREALLTARRAEEAATDLMAVMEQRAVEADAARITAEAAREACLHAREALARCEEEAVAAVAGVASAGAGAAPQGPPKSGRVAAATSAGGPGRGPAGAAGEPGEPVDELGAVAASAAGGEPLLFRLLRRDGAALRKAVAALAGDSATEQRRWQIQLTDLVDAIVARAIEACSLDFPIDNPFWAPFSREQSREVAAALGSLGYKFDGLGGFSDGRVPSQRDLSLAVGFAGLDPMRIRRWPSEADAAALFRDVAVAADEYIAATAPNVTLGEMVALLGRRAEGLTELWNAWGRVRPILLSTD